MYYEITISNSPFCLPTTQSSTTLKNAVLTILKKEDAALFYFSQIGLDDCEVSPTFFYYQIKSCQKNHAKVSVKRVEHIQGKL